jgi:hypothetical protein
MENERIERWRREEEAAYDAANAKSTDKEPVAQPKE